MISCGPCTQPVDLLADLSLLLRIGRGQLRRLHNQASALMLLGNIRILFQSYLRYPQVDLPLSTKEPSYTTIPSS